MKAKHIAAALLLLIPMVIFANEGGGGHYEAITGRSYDIIPRIVNFLIFAGIVYYLLANPIKEFFTGRQKGIADQLKDIEARLQASKDAKKEAEEKVEESKKRAEEIVQTAAKEAEVLAKKIADISENELKAMEKQYEEKMLLEKRKVVRETISSVLNENISTDDIQVDEKKVIDLLDRKVA